MNGEGGGEGMVWEEANLPMSWYIIGNFLLPPRSGWRNVGKELPLQAA